MSFFTNFEQISITDYENHDYSPFPNCRGGRHFISNSFVGEGGGIVIVWVGEGT